MPEVTLTLSSNPKKFRVRPIILSRRRVGRGSDPRPLSPTRGCYSGSSHQPTLGGEAGLRCRSRDSHLLHPVNGSGPAHLNPASVTLSHIPVVFISQPYQWSSLHPPEQGAFIMKMPRECHWHMLAKTKDGHSLESHGKGVPLPSQHWQCPQSVGPTAFPCYAWAVSSSRSDCPRVCPACPGPLSSPAQR